MKGSIQRYFWSKGYGFIDAEDGHSYFFHISNVDIPEGQFPKIGQGVTFELVENYMGKEAVEVKLV